MDIDIYPEAAGMTSTNPICHPKSASPHFSTQLSRRLCRSGLLLGIFFVGCESTQGLVEEPTALLASFPATAPASEPLGQAAIGPATAPADPAAPLFDSNRHMRISEVKPGMKGFGLSVFKGTKIERFDVEVLSVLKNFNPKHDVILINCPGEYLVHTGSIAGMSGSPIFLRDDQGRDRMIGAFAYGWPLAKDALAGIQPIEYMLEIPVELKAGPGTRPAKPVSDPMPEAGDQSRVRSGASQDRSDAGARLPRWTYLDATEQCQKLLSRGRAAQLPPGVAQARTDGVLPELQPLATPLMASGIPPTVLRQLSGAFEPLGLRPMQAGGVSPSGTQPVVQFSPGSVLAVPLLTGDADLTAVGTCTEVIGDRIFGFGHPFNNEGRVELPMGPGEIHGIVASLTTSFKLGSMSSPGGTLTTDQSVGIAGRTGAAPKTAPMDIVVVDQETGAKKNYHFDSAIHPRFTPLLAGVAISSAASGISELPQYNTTEWQMDLEFANGRKVRLADRAINVESMKLSQVPLIPMMAAVENPFGRVPLTKLTATLTISKEVKDGSIIDVNLPRDVYHPGEKVKAFVTYRPFRGAEAVLPVDMDLPRDLPAGAYQFVVSDADRFNTDEMTTRSFRFTAQRIDELFDVLVEAQTARHDAIYLRLIRQSDGVAVGRTALPLLPSGRRQLLLESGRSDTTQFVSSATKVIPTDGRVMAGQAQFNLTIEAVGKGTSRGHSPASRPAVGPHADDLKPIKPGGVDAQP